MSGKFDSQAEALATLQKIQQYWAERGYDVQGYVSPGGYSGRLRAVVYEIQTDLKNGMPAQHAQIKAS